MTNEKFHYEVTTVTKFIQIYCDDKHQDREKNTENISIDYNDTNNVVSVNFHLCKECSDMAKHAYYRLSQCPHIEKPRCHKCPHPCYELAMWKKMAKMMKYSGMKLGLNKIKRLFFG
ncbi:nitrous oxide-stimulated promoter family protein [Campylobacter majalis]|uniref:nitrous oxide-stimulated promoter family protein n=1 Tax=Campylobacter majalis TaxID=2790656 RepID=UPI003D684E14